MFIPVHMRNPAKHLHKEGNPQTGACLGFLKGGGPISLGSLKKRSSDFKRGGPMV